MIRRLSGRTKSIGRKRVPIRFYVMHTVSLRRRKLTAWLQLQPCVLDANQAPKLVFVMNTEAGSRRSVPGNLRVRFKFDKKKSIALKRNPKRGHGVNESSDCTSNHSFSLFSGW